MNHDQSLLDLTDICDELLYLCRDARDRLLSAKLPLTTMLSDTYLNYNEQLDELSTRLQHDSLSPSDMLEIYESLTHIELELRTVQGIRGAVQTATQWQSPSFATSGLNQAGSEIGKISMGINDYKRDQHQAGRDYEQAFRRAYITSFPFSFVKVYATSSGMAAFATILGFLQGEQKLKGPILVGKSCYFEEKNLLHTLFPTQIVEVDEHDLTAIRRAIETKKPTAVFFDSICNSPDMALPNLVAIVDIIRKQKRSDLILVIDNTGLSVTFQSLQLKHLHDPYVQIIIWESLLKYHQFGMDRVNGGIIYSSARDDIKLYDYRDHLGTNIAESVVTSLPSPNSKILKKRLSRHERNIQYLAQALPDRVAFPGLPVHPSFSWSQTLSFHGAIMTVLFAKDHQNLHTYKRFLHLIIERARKESITVIAGSSFGFSTTRVYIPASYGHQAEPFFRIAVGTEPEFIFQKIAEIIRQTCLTVR